MSARLKVLLGAVVVVLVLAGAGLWWFFREAWYCALLSFTLNTAAYQAEILRGAIESVPRGQWEGAASLGFHKWLTLRKIVLPVAIPGIITAALFSFTLSWGEYLYSITFVTDSWEKTIPSAVVGELIRGDVYYWGELMAGALLGSVPIAMIYVVFLDYYVSGLTAGATKG